LDGRTLVRTQQRHGGRIGEAAGSDQAIRGGATLADQYRGAVFPQRFRHRVLPSRLVRPLCG
jgi:hypothetical protein